MLVPYVAPPVGACGFTHRASLTVLWFLVLPVLDNHVTAVSSAQSACKFCYGFSLRCFPTSSARVDALVINSMIRRSGSPPQPVFGTLAQSGFVRIHGRGAVI